MIDNDFFKQKVTGPTKEISIQRAIELACGSSMFMSKRLAPPLTICNGRVYAGGEFVYKSDIEVAKVAGPLTRIAEEYGVELFITREHGSDIQWRSSQPEMWLGGWVTPCGAYSPLPVTISQAWPFFEAEAKRRRRQWMLSRGMVRRNPKEMWSDFRWAIKHKLYDVRRWIERRTKNEGTSGV